MPDRAQPTPQSPESAAAATLGRATRQELDMLLDSLGPVAPERLRGLYQLQLVAVRGSDRLAVLWRPLRTVLNRWMTLVFRGKFFAVNCGHNEIVGLQRALPFSVGPHPEQSGHLLIDYDTADAPRFVRPLAAEIRCLSEDTLLCCTVWRRSSRETRLLYFTLQSTVRR